MVEEIRSYLLNSPEYSGYVYFPEGYDANPIGPIQAQFRNVVLGLSDTLDPKVHCWRANALVAGIYRDPQLSKLAQELFDPRTLDSREVGSGSLDVKFSISSKDQKLSVVGDQLEQVALGAAEKIVIFSSRSDSPDVVVPETTDNNVCSVNVPNRRLIIYDPSTKDPSGGDTLFLFNLPEGEQVGDTVVIYDRYSVFPTYADGVSIYYGGVSIESRDNSTNNTILGITCVWNGSSWDLSDGNTTLGIRIIDGQKITSSYMQLRFYGGAAGFTKVPGVPLKVAYSGSYIPDTLLETSVNLSYPNNMSIGDLISKVEQITGLDHMIWTNPTASEKILPLYTGLDRGYKRLLCMVMAYALSLKK